jgi:hypothetical protein
VQEHLTRYPIEALIQDLPWWENRLCKDHSNIESEINIMR